MTVMLPVELMERAKSAAIQWQTSLKALVEEGLRDALARQQEDS